MSNLLKKVLAVTTFTIFCVGLSIYVISNNIVNQEVKMNEEPINYYTNTISSPPIPEVLAFAGETVPAEVYWVHEGLEKEIISQCYLHSRTLFIMKRTGRFFPIIEKILKEENVPDDFKYLCLAESGLENVVSPAKAAGFWQFLESTGRSYGLEINEYVDERYDVEKATRAACAYLRACKNRLGSWTLAAAAYNMGENGLQRSRNAQNKEDYYDLWLNSETARYVYRILAFKVLYEHQADYGIHLNKSDSYRAIPCKEITVTSSIAELPAFAVEHGVLYREIKSLNPWLRSNKLPINGKVYKIKIPERSHFSYKDLM